MDLPVAAVELDLFYSGYAFVQDIFPDLSAEEREFLITGITPDE